MEGTLRLPDELMVRVLENLRPQDIRACQLVCRYFRVLIQTSLPTRYILALDSLGYTTPGVPRTDLTLDRKLELLGQHRQNWNFPPICQPIELILGVNSLTPYEYVGGVYVCSIESTSRPPTRGLRFYQLPSPNLGLEFREWCMPDLGLDAWGFTIEPDQNLLVVLDIHMSSPGQYNGFRVHLRTMEKNEPHPKATTPILLADLGCWQADGEPSGTSEMDALPYKGFSLEATENLLAILFKSRSGSTPSWVIVWDWSRGVEVTRVSTTYTHTGGPGTELSFTLLSHDTLLLPKFSKSCYGQAYEPDDTFGSLDVYTFNPHGAASAPPRMIASYGLPELGETGGLSTVTIIRGSKASLPQGGRPRVYGQSPQDQFVCFVVRLHPLHDGAGWPWSKMLFVPTHILLDSRTHLGNIHGTSNHPVPDPSFNMIQWSLWAHHVSWVNVSDAQPLSKSSFDSQRMAMVSFSLIGEVVQRSVLVYDFSQKRKKWLESGMGGTTGKVHGSGTDKMTSTVGAPFNKDDGASPQLEYVKKTLEVGNKGVWKALIDDEHLILQEERNGSLVLEVYTF